MLRVVIVDDEPLARRGLREQLAEHGGVEVIGEACHADEAVRLVREVRPDAIFLDIQMPRLSGFHVLEAGGIGDTPVVFVTAHSQHAVRAFDFQAIDYLLKPIRPEKLARAIARISAAIGVRGPDPPAYEEQDTVCLRTPERTLVSPISDISLLVAEKDFTQIHVASSRPLMICRSLGAYEKELPSPPFLRIDRSHIVNLSCIQAIEVSPTRGTFLSLQGLDSPLPLGRAACKRLRQALPQHFHQI